jgi:TP901 family phage tail tape measure protein
MTQDLGALRARLEMDSRQFSNSLKQTRTELTGMTSSTRSTDQAMRGLQNTTSSMRRAAESGIVPASRLARDLEQQMDGVSEASGEASNALADLGNAAAEGSSVATTNVQEMLSTIQAASAAIGGAILAGVGASVKVAADFEAQMSRVKAISGATGEEFEALKEKALELGQKTSKSASEIAIAFEDMAAMGFNATQIIEAMPGVIAAAEASGSDLALTSGVVAAALNGFKMEASDASKVADILAKTANVSAASVSDLGFAFKYAAPVAQTLGISIEELAAATGIMIDAGMDGSQAGTTLRMALLRLADPTKEGAEALEKLGVKTTDASGQFAGLTKILPAFVKGLDGMTNSQKVAALATIFGAEAATGMLTVIEGGVDKFNDFTGALENSAGASKEAADIMKDNLKGAADELMGAFETLGIKVGDEFLPMLTDIVKRGADVVSAISEMNTSALKSGLTFAGTAATIALVISSIGKLALATRALMVSMGPAGWLITGLSILGGVFVTARMESDKFAESNMKRISGMVEEAQALDTSIKTYDDLKLKIQLTNSEFGRYLDINSRIKNETDPKVIESLTAEQAKLLEKSGLTNEEMQKFLEANDLIIEKVPQSNVVLSEQGRIFLENADAAKEMNQQKYEEIRLELEIAKSTARETIKQDLEKQEQIMGNMNNLQEKRQANIEKIKEQEKLVGQLQGELREAQESGDKKAIFQAEAKLLTEKDQLDVMNIQHTKLLEEIQAQQGSLDKVSEKIKKLDKVNQQMIQLELKMAGINAKHGEEIKTIDATIGKLEAQKKKLHDTTPVAQRNTKEYQEAQAAIQGQIDKLNITKARIEEIIGKAGVMNSELGRDIYKQVLIEEKVSRQHRGNYGSPRQAYHTGGIVGQRPLNTVAANSIGDDSEESRQKARLSLRMLELISGQREAS